MRVQQLSGKGFTPSLMALAICLATSPTAFAADAEPSAAPIVLGATQVSGE